MPQSFIELKPPIDPHLRRWMLFVDGENLTLRAQELAKEKNVQLVEGPAYAADVYVWLPGVQPTQNIIPYARLGVQAEGIRAYYYTSLVGAEERIVSVKEALRELGFSPEVFKKIRREQKAKGVDIALAKDILGHAYRDNYDVAVLLAGDGDYVPLVVELKRLGKVVYVAFFENHGLSKELWLEADMFFELEPFFFDQWKRHPSGAVVPSPKPSPVPQTQSVFRRHAQ
jgi:uncharacterized LabA/DUF88 family protein